MTSAAMNRMMWKSHSSVIVVVRQETIKAAFMGKKIQLCVDSKQDHYGKLFSSKTVMNNSIQRWIQLKIVSAYWSATLHFSTNTISFLMRKSCFGLQLFTPTHTMVWTALLLNKMRGAGVTNYLWYWPLKNPILVMMKLPVYRMTLVTKTKYRKCPL